MTRVRVPSGEQWLGNVPVDWELVPAKTAFNERREANHAEDVHLTPSQTYGVLPQTDYMAMTGNAVVQNITGQDNMKHVEPDDFIIHLRSFQGGIERSTHAGKVSAAYTVLRPRDGVFARYFRWLLKSSAYVQELRTTTNQLRDGQSIKFRDFTKVPLPLPPLDEQRAIADYLDHETARVDTLIEEQQRLIEMLVHRKAAVVDAAVTRGLREGVPLAHSGVDWIGPIPAGWRTQPLWSMFRRTKDVNHPDEQMLSVFRDYGVVAKDSRANLNKTAENRDIYQLVHPGWLVTNRMKAWQGSVGISSLRGIVSGHYICFAPTHSEDDSFLNWLFRSPRYALGYGLISRGVRIGQAEIDNDHYRVMPVVVPPLEEQRQIAAYLDEQTAKLDTLIDETERFIDLSRERRSALITAAVTGQIDVREVA